MHFLIYRDHPNEGSAAYKKYAGADIACWINDTDMNSAKARAEKQIQQQNWTIDKLEESYPLTREMTESSTGLQYFEQALIDGGCWCFSPVPRLNKSRLPVFSWNMT